MVCFSWDAVVHGVAVRRRPGGKRAPGERIGADSQDVLDRRADRAPEKDVGRRATASQIADELGGVSRNAVIGKAHRLGLEQRPSPVKPGEEKGRRSPAPARRARPRPPPRPSRDRRRLPPAPAAPPRQRRRGPTKPAASAPEMQYARSAPAGSSARAPATSSRRSRPRPRAGWSRPSPAPRSPTRPACSSSTTASANGRSAIPASPISTSAASRRTPASPIASSIAGSPTKPSSRAATAGRPRRCPSAVRGSAEVVESSEAVAKRRLSSAKRRRSRTACPRQWDRSDVTGLEWARRELPVPTPKTPHPPHEDRPCRFRCQEARDWSCRVRRTLSIRYEAAIKGDGSSEGFEEIHGTVMKTSPNYFNLNRPIRMESTLRVG